MWKKTCLLWLLVFAGSIVLTVAAEKGVWVGTRFQPKQCLKIAAGNFEVKRKLCTIAYAISSRNGQFEIEGRLQFDSNFIPDKVSEVELEVLLIDQEWVCSKQLDLRTKVVGNQAQFSFVTDDVPSQRHVRTYYIIHYKQTPISSAIGRRISNRRSSS